MKVSWEDYIRELQSTSDIVDDISISEGSGESHHISDITKVSLLLLDKMINGGSLNNILVFPDLDSIKYEFLLAKEIHNISAGWIDMSYDPHHFVKGQKLKYKNCVVEFDGFNREKDGIDRIWIRTRDNTRYGIPIVDAPFFQAVESKKLSTSKLFDQARKDTSYVASYLAEELSKHKTHLSSSIVFVSKINASLEWMKSSTICGEKTVDVLYLGHCTGDGIVKNISSGQMTGNPAIIFATDLYSVQNALSQKVLNIQSLIIDLPYTKDIENQLDVLDELIASNIPVLCITDTINSLGHNSLLERGFYEWRWDKRSLSRGLATTNTFSSKRLLNCLNGKVEYININTDDIDEICKTLYLHKNEIENFSPSMTSVFEKLFSLAFFALRSIIPSSVLQLDYYVAMLSDCTISLEKEKRFLDAKLYSDFQKVIAVLKSFFHSNYRNKKCEYIQQFLATMDNKRIGIIVPENFDKTLIKKYWSDWNEMEFKPIDILCFSPQEYKECSYFLDAVIVSGWLGEKAMRNILYSYVAVHLYVLMYPYECKWQGAHIRVWKKTFDGDSNLRTSTLFTQSNREIDVSRFLLRPEETSNVSTPFDELSDIEALVLRSKYKRYGASSSSANSKSLVSALPISFVGGYLAFYREGHKVITATDIIVNNANQIQMKLPEELKLGDFIVIRDSGSDIIKDLADEILREKGEQYLRNFANKWREALEVELVFHTEKELYEKLQEAGCKKGRLTVKNWLNNENLIIPQDKEDLKYIAKVTEDPVLIEKLDQIYKAGAEIKAAHINAGRLLSTRLKKQIHDAIKEMGTIDTFNIWEPICFQMEGIGAIRIMKIIDLGQQIPIEIGNTNRLIAEG